MARKTTTVHSCDRCGTDVARPRDLRRFEFAAYNPWAEVRLDLCADCETRTLEEFAAWANADVSALVKEPK